METVIVMDMGLLVQTNREDLQLQQQASSTVLCCCYIQAQMQAPSECIAQGRRLDLGVVHHTMFCKGSGSGQKVLDYSCKIRIIL